MSHPPVTAVREVVARALAEDLEPLGDITGALLPVDVLVRAELVARADGVLAGRLCADEAFAQVDPTVVTVGSWTTATRVLEPGTASPRSRARWRRSSPPSAPP